MWQKEHDFEAKLLASANLQQILFIFTRSIPIPDEEWVQEGLDTLRDAFQNRLEMVSRMVDLARTDTEAGEKELQGITNEIDSFLVMVGKFAYKFKKFEKMMDDMESKDLEFIDLQESRKIESDKEVEEPDAKPAAKLKLDEPVEEPDAKPAAKLKLDEPVEEPAAEVPDAAVGTKVQAPVSAGMTPTSFQTPVSAGMPPPISRP
ncbi:MAG: hypothetical protein SGARI_005372, partial [Bacillariaceae sp.]